MTPNDATPSVIPLDVLAKSGTGWLSLNDLANKLLSFYELTKRRDVVSDASKRPGSELKQRRIFMDAVAMTTCSFSWRSTVMSID